MQESSSLFPFLDLLQDISPRNQQQPLNTTDFRISRNYPHPTVGRPGGRPTLPPVDRVPNRELGTFSRSTERSTELFPCARCARRSTEFLMLRAVDRAGRPANLFCCCCYFLLLSPFAFSSSTSLAITSTTPRQSMSTSSAIFSLSNRSKTI